MSLKLRLQPEKIFNGAHKPYEMVIVSIASNSRQHMLMPIAALPESLHADLKSGKTLTITANIDDINDIYDLDRNT